MDQYPAAPHSSFVTVLAWIFVVLAGFATLVAIAQNVLINTVFPAAQVRDAMNAAAARESIPPLARFLFGHFRLFFATFLVLSAASLVSAIGLLRRMNWARVAFIGLLALGIVWNLSSLVLQLAMFSPMPPVPLGAPAGAQVQFQPLTVLIIRVSSAVVAVGLSVLFGWIILRLRSAAVRQEFARRR